MKTITLIFLVLVISYSYGNDKIDSLLSVLSSEEVSERYEVLTNLADAYYYQSNLIESARYYKLAADFTESQKDPNLRHISESYGNYGYCLHELGRYNESIIQYEKGLSAALKNQDSTEIAAHYNNMGISFFLMGNYEKSIHYYQSALEIDKAQNKIESIGIDYSVIGNVLAVWGKHDRAKSFFIDALKIARDFNNPKQICSRLNKLGATMIALEQYDSAIYLLNEALQISTEVNLTNNKALILNQIAFAYHNSSQFTKAEAFYLDALKELESYPDIKTEIIIYANLAENFFLKGNGTKAEDYCTESLIKAKEIGLTSFVVKNLELLSRIAQSKGNYQTALEFHQQYLQFKDSLFTVESQKKLAEFEVLYEMEKKEGEIRLLNSEKLLDKILIKESQQRFYMLVVISLLLLFVLGLIYYQYRERKKINELLSEKNIQLKELNATKDRFISIIAHDLKNPFTAFYNIASALYNKQNKMSKEDSGRLIESIYESSQKLKSLLTSLLEWARLQRNNLDVEVEKLDLNKIVSYSISNNEAVGNSKNINFLNKVNKEISVLANENTLMTVLNNVLTNAVKFSEPNENVILRSRFENNHVDLTVEDHGIGMNDDEIKKLFRVDIDSRTIGNSKEKGTGMGLILCKELLEKIKGSIRVESTSGKGSKFIVSLPLAK